MLCIVLNECNEVSKCGRGRQPNDQRSEPRAVWGHPASFLLRLLRASEGCFGCEDGNENEAEAASPRNESERNEANTNPKRIQNVTKTKPKCTKNQPKRDPKPPQRIQTDPERSKLAQVGAKLGPETAHGHPRTTPRKVSKPTFSQGKTTIWTKRAILDVNRMKTLQKQTYQF